MAQDAGPADEASGEEASTDLPSAAADEVEKE